MARKFSWGNFDKEFIEGVLFSAETKKGQRPAFHGAEKSLYIPYMDGIATLPDDTFVKKYRKEIEDYFLLNSSQLTRIAKNLQDKGRRGVAAGGSPQEMLDQLKKLHMTSSLLEEYKSALRQHGRNVQPKEFDVSRFKYPVTIDLAATPLGPGVKSLYDFQQTAVEALFRSLVLEDKSAGLLVMPTGSGKTRTAVHFLLRKMVSAGYQVIWLAHRSMLIDQAADAFNLMCPLVKLENARADQFKFVCVSGEHAQIQATEKHDNVIVLGTQTISRNMDYLAPLLAEKVIIVIDEAHHAVASTYRRVMGTVWKTRPDAKLLGLTATPVRMEAAESARLYRMFGENIIFQIPMADLIKKGILAEPIFERVDTGLDMAPLITKDDQEYIKKYGEIGAILASKIAESAKRNRLILDTYLKGREKYGKTLIFGLNIEHCISMCKEFKDHGIRCDYIYSNRSDNEAIIQQYKKNELDVLMNINILTEGSDVPDIRTVFLTRPTNSDVLLMQMIGRGLRGIHAGGTEIANIVDFQDKWQTFNMWLNPQFLYSEEEADPVSGKRVIGPRWSLPLSVIEEIYKTMEFEPGTDAQVQVSMPHGWYSVLTEEGTDATVIVYDNQLAGYKAMERDCEDICGVGHIPVEQFKQSYFNDFGPAPSERDLELMQYAIKTDKCMPQYYVFEARKAVDPICVARNLLKENVGLRDLHDRIADIYNCSPEIQDIFRSLEYYHSRVLNCISYDNGQVPWGAAIEEVPLKNMPFTIVRGTHKLTALMQSVLEERFGADKGTIPTIQWTSKCFKTYLAQYRKDDNVILVNRLLDSRNVSAEVVKYIIYHELLHRDNMSHDAAFRERERSYPDYTELEKDIYKLFHDYNIDYDA